MIESIRFRFGASPGAKEPLELELAPLTVFVGPNNGGKSLALREIEHYCRTGRSNANSVSVDRMTFTPFEEDEFDELVGRLKTAAAPGERVSAGNVVIEMLAPGLSGRVRHELHYQQAKQEAGRSGCDRLDYIVQIVSALTMRLDASNRVALLEKTNIGDLKKVPTNHLASLFQNDTVRAELRKIAYEAFGRYLVLDPTDPGHIEVRLSERAPENAAEERGWEDAAVAFHSAAQPIAECSDGVKAFCGILAVLMAGNPYVFLVDEPEAFLHPGLSRRLGQHVAQYLGSGRRRLFAATHSASFLMGCIQSGCPLNVVRLTYRDSVATARVLRAEQLRKLMRNPLLRSTGVLQGLFYESVVVTEADPDRAFYEEVNQRLLDKGDPRAIQNCLFLNARNKQTVWEIVRPLRELGIPAVGVVDIDVLKEGGRVWNKPMEGAFIPKSLRETLRQHRQSLLTCLEATGKCMKREGGLGLLQPEDRQTGDALFDSLAKYGVFVVRGGELESWLKHLGCTDHGPRWLSQVFEAMGEEGDDTYVGPGSGDVWDFVGSIGEWLQDPQRLGLPSD